MTIEIAKPLPRNTSFSLTMPGHQIAWDSTSLGALKTCARYYEYTIINGYAPRAESAHLKFGIEYHAALETYDRARAEGASHDIAICVALRHAFINTWRFDLGRPWPSDEPTKNRETLIRTIVWYLDQFADDPLETIVLRNGQPAVEQSFRFDIGFSSNLSGEHYMLCGHLDRIVMFNDAPWIVDRKTTKATLSTEYFAKYSPHNQMSLYSVAGTMIYGQPIAGLIIDAAQIGVSFSRFRRGTVPRTNSQLNEWIHDTQTWLRIAEAHAKARYWPMNDHACDHYGGCPFRQVCGASPEVRQRLLDGLYTRRVWDPLVTREI